MNAVAFSLEALSELLFEKGIIDKDEHMKLTKKLFAEHQSAASQQPQKPVDEATAPEASKEINAAPEGAPELPEAEEACNAASAN